MDKLRELQVLLTKIPRGKVTTYGEIARKLGVHPRHAGRLLSMNDCPEKYPCYKVIRSDGRLGGYSSEKGVKEKVRRLEKDGIEVKKSKVDLKKHFFKF